MPGDLELALRVRADMAQALRGIGSLNRGLGDTERRSGEADAALTGATGAAQAFTTALGAIGGEGEGALEEAGNAAERVFGAMDAALARFVATGKLEFSGFVDSVIADLARIATRRYITAPLAELLFGALGQGAGVGIQHAGGRVGAPGGVIRQVPPAIFADAPRFHSGGIAGLRADEVPIIAQAGETILPRGATIAAPSVEITFENRGTPQREVSREVRLDPRGLIVNVVTDDLRRGGPIRQTMAQELGGGLP